MSFLNTILPIKSNGIWKEFKTAGLKVKLISSASYNASSSNDEK